MSGNVTIVAIGVVVASRASVGIGSSRWPLVSGCGWIWVACWAIGTSSGLTVVGAWFGHGESKEKKGKRTEGVCRVLDRRWLKGAFRLLIPYKQ